ncbi:hypothetical protein SK128_008525 [Halocaridina rubra]|uniref:Uncharacterized protein n=1 Tax=Halocaridina rubra TaxID=373956 RepID=A0AAN8XCA1_HALRR
MPNIANGQTNRTSIAQTVPPHGSRKRQNDRETLEWADSVWSLSFPCVEVSVRRDSVRVLEPERGQR